ncbi:MAG: hypothetical protein L0922_02090, partial [Candidatus Mariimomonas ferrooxydans]
MNFLRILPARCIRLTETQLNCFTNFSGTEASGTNINPFCSMSGICPASPHYLNHHSRPTSPHYLNHHS